MRDPIPAPSILLQSPYIQNLSQTLGLSTLPLHIHEIALGFTLYQSIQTIFSPWLSRMLVPKLYNSFSKRTKLNWDVHVVSMVQSLFINTAALTVILSDETRSAWDWSGRLWGYEGSSGFVQGMAAGYFLWDVSVSSQHLDVLGPGSLAHAIGALCVSCIGFRPFANFYGVNFILYELSTPALNIHWFLDKLGMTGGTAQLINGFLLLGSFGACRLVWGSYQSVLIYKDIWKGLGFLRENGLERACEVQASMSQGYSLSTSATGAGSSALAECSKHPLPMWLVVTYLGSNTILSGLNFYWFFKMIQAVQKRFTPEAKEKKKEEVDGPEEKKER